MALPVHELFKDRDVWEFWRETGVFQKPFLASATT
jgi:hypothetical protein